MTREEAIKKLEAISDNSDWEKAHIDADEVLCDFLTELGYSDVIVAYDKVGKWYA